MHVWLHLLPRLTCSASGRSLRRAGKSETSRRGSVACTGLFSFSLSRVRRELHFLFHDLLLYAIPAACIGGHLTEPYEQNTQQSPAFGRSRAPQPAHS